MAPPGPTVTFTFRQPGVKPPVFVAGTFGIVEWLPLQMDYTVDEHGEYTFKLEVLAMEGEEIQYKFKLGEDWWALNEEAEKVQDGQGNTNNLIRVPRTSSDPDQGEDLKPRVHSAPLFPHEMPGPGDQVVRMPDYGKDEEREKELAGLEADFAAWVQTSTRGSRGSLHSDQACSSSSLQSIQEEGNSDDRNGATSSNGGTRRSSRAPSVSRAATNPLPPIPVVIEVTRRPSQDAAANNASVSNEDIQDEGICMSNDADTGRDSQTSLVRRRITSSGEERALTPASMHSIHQADKGNWLRAFLHTLFVDWIGGFLSRTLFGNKRKA